MSARLSASASVSGAFSIDDEDLADFSGDVSGIEVVRKEDGGPTSEFNETSAGDSFFAGGGDDSRAISDVRPVSSVFCSVADCCATGGVSSTEGGADSVTRMSKTGAEVARGVTSELGLAVSDFVGIGVGSKTDVPFSVFSASAVLFFSATVAGVASDGVALGLFATGSIGRTFSGSGFGFFVVSAADVVKRFRASTFSASALRLSAATSSGTDILAGDGPRAQAVTRPPSTK